MLSKAARSRFESSHFESYHRAWWWHHNRWDYDRGVCRRQYPRIHTAQVHVVRDAVMALEAGHLDYAPAAFKKFSVPMQDTSERFGVCATARFLS